MERQHSKELQAQAPAVEPWQGGLGKHQAQSAGTEEELPRLGQGNLFRSSFISVLS